MAKARTLWAITEDQHVVWIGISFGHPDAEEHFEPDPNCYYDEIVLWINHSKDKEEITLREAVLIQALKPKYNKQWKKDEK